MSSFSIGSTSTNGTSWLRGFSFNPSVTGTDGSGSGGTTSGVSVDSISVGCPTQAAAEEGDTCYIYSKILDDPSEIGQSDGLVAQSQGSSESTDGSAYMTNYAFQNAMLNPNAEYYVYFSDDKDVNVDRNTPYAGGTAYDTFMGDDGSSPQFTIDMLA